MKHRKKKGTEKNKQSLSKLWHNTKQELCATGVPNSEGEKYLKKIMTEIFPNFIKTVNHQIHKAQHQT